MVNMLFSLYNFNEKWAKNIVSKYINSNNRVLIIPFSFDEDIKSDMEWQSEFNKYKGRHYKVIEKTFSSYGVSEKNIKCINYFKDTKESAKDKIKNSDVIFFTGGLPDKMMYRLNEFDLINEIENFKGIIIGSSAGAMIQIKDYHITPDEDYNTFSYNKGLNLIKNFDIEVHYEGTETQEKYINKVLNEKSDTVYAIKNTGGIIIDNNVTTLLGDTCTFSR